jgi:type VI secretion system secreted protein Hcp
MDVKKKVRFFVVVGLVAAAAAAGATVAVAAGPSTSGSTYYACLRSGKLIDVGVAAPTCPGTSQQISWNSQGSPGATGPQGPVGQASVVNVPNASLFSNPCPQSPGVNSGPTGTQAFLDIPSIPGESTNSNHLNQIDLLSWSLGIAGGSSAASCAGSHSSAGGVSGDQLTVVKYVDKASPPIMIGAAGGSNLGKVTLTVSKVSNGTTTDYLVYTFTNTVTTGVQWLSGGGQPEEQVTFDYGAIQVNYSPQNPDGTLGSPIVACFNIVTQAGC